jgi:peptidylprolyl isomerase
MKKAKTGDLVKFRYTAQTEDGQSFGTKGDHPVELHIGEGQYVLGLENGIIGMGIGEKKAFTVSPEEGFGKRREELVLKVKKDRMPDNMKVKIGQKLQVKTNDENVMDAQVVEIADETVTLDANHPLAGQALQFHVEMVDIK